MHYYVERIIDGKPHWWRSKSYGVDAGWQTNIREATRYGRESRARIAVFQIRKHYPFDGDVKIVPYHISPVRLLWHWPEHEGVTA
jgi:hypothetical protein